MSYLHFFDDWKLLARTNLERKIGRPRYVPEATLVDPLTEGTWNFPTVTRLPDGKYVALYGGAGPVPSGFSNATEGKPLGKCVPKSQVLCYAESADGIHWERPDFSDVPLDGPRRAKNQVYAAPHPAVEGMPVFYDPYDKNPARRFKYFVNMVEEVGVRGWRALLCSPDGKSWRMEKEYRDFGATDTPTQVFYRPEDETYVLNTRKYCGDRRVFFWETKDWETFSEPYLVMHPTPHDPPLAGFYGMPVYRYEDLYIGLLWTIYNDPTATAFPDGAIDCSLAYSYEGKTFNRATYAPFIERNELGEHGGGCIYAGSMMVDENNAIRFYSGGSKAEHFQNQNLDDAALMLHTLRLDGFVYLATTSGGGSILTRPLRITGDDLRINVRCPWGEVRVRVLDESKKPIGGFDFGDCAPFRGDELFWQPQWSGGLLSRCADPEKFRYLEVSVYTGELYALRGDFDIPPSVWHD